MKVYVRGYWPKKSEDVEPPKRIWELNNDAEVQFCNEPEWTLATREQAESDLQILQSMCVHVGTHYCEFAIEELPEGQLAIVCPTHPQLHSSKP